MGMTEDGQFFAGGEIGFDMNIGLIDLEGSVNGYVEVGPDGFEMAGGWDGKVGILGAFVEGGQQGSFAYSDGEATVTYEEYRGAGHALLGSVRVGTELQFQTDGTKDGTSLTGGLYGSTNNPDGEETGMLGVYTQLDSSGLSSPWVQDEHLDTGVTHESYDRHHDSDDDSGMPTSPDGSADYRAEFPGAVGDDGEAGRRHGASSRDVFDAIEPNPAVDERVRGYLGETEKNLDPARGRAGDRQNHAEQRATDDAPDNFIHLRDDATGVRNGSETDSVVRPEFGDGIEDRAPSDDLLGTTYGGDVAESGGTRHARSTQTNERDLGLDEAREPIGSVDSNNDVGLDAVRGAAGPPQAAGESLHGDDNEAPRAIHLAGNDAATAAVASPPPPPSGAEPGSELFSTHGAGNELWSMDASTTEVRAQGEDPNLPLKSVAPDAVPHKRSADRPVEEAPRDDTGRPGADLGDDGAAGAPWKGLPRDVAPITASSQTVAPRQRIGDDGGADAAPGTDVPADDITTMSTGEGAAGGTDGLEVGRAPRHVDIAVVDDSDSVAQVETAIPLHESPPDEPFVLVEATPEPEPLPEPPPIEHEPLPLPEPEPEPPVDDVLDDDLDG